MIHMVGTHIRSTLIVTVASLFVAMACPSLGSANAQSDTRLLVLPPNHALYIQVHPSLPAYFQSSEDGVEVKISLWESLTGTLLKVEDDHIIYQAPSGGFDVVYWSSQPYGKPELRFVVMVARSGEYSPTSECPEIEIVNNNGVPGFFIPVNGNISVSLFVPCVDTTEEIKLMGDRRIDGSNCVTLDGSKIKVCPLPQPNPLTPPDGPNGVKPDEPYPGRRCRTGNRSSVVRTYSAMKSFERNIGVLKITESLATKLSELGFEFTVGTKLKVIQQVTRLVTWDVEDCYECRNGVWVLVGQKVNWTACDKITYVSPANMCAILNAVFSRGDPYLRNLDTFIVIGVMTEM